MTHQTFTLDDLRVILREVAGAGESAGTDGDILDTSFEELGYDSLLLLEAEIRIGDRYGIALDDPGIDRAQTPRTVIETVNALLSRKEGAHT
jgi:minimal PKS acyl carrier protein